jgi:hypothetical protein
LQGDIGRVMGIDWYGTAGVLTHTAGTVINNSSARELAVNNSGGYAAGTSALNVDKGAASTATGTLVLGDIIKFAGHSQTYTVIANPASGNYSNGAYTLGSNAVSGLMIYPPLRAPVIDDEVITIMASHVVNMAYHRDAFGFAMRSLQSENALLNSIGGSIIQSYQDPMTGIVLRLEVSRQHKQVTWEFDILWGSSLVRPELAVRLIG